MNLILRNRNGFPVPVAFRQNPLDKPFEQLIDSMYEDFFAPASAQEMLMSSPRINVVETPKSYEVEAELPGVTKNDVRIAVDNRQVSIEAEVKRDSENLFKIFLSEGFKFNDSKHEKALSERHKPSAV